MAATDPAGKVIIWEYQSDIPGLFSPYSDKVSNYVEDQHVKDPTGKVLLSNVEPLLKEYELDFSSNVQYSNRSGSQRTVRRQLYDESTDIGSGISWEWMTDIGWVSYDVEASSAIETAFSKNEAEIDLQTLTFGLPNVVMIQKGYQRNKNSGFVRPIQRRAVKYKSSTPIPKPSVRKKKVQTTSSSPLNGTDSVTTTSATSTSTRKRTKSSKSVELIDKPLNPNIGKYCTIITNPKEGEDCAICLISLVDDDDACGVIDRIVQLKKCKHSFHESCMEAYCKQGQQNGCIQCPICKKIHGIKLGNQPRGRMTVSTSMKSSVAGCEGCGMITITYDIKSGIQGPEHPNPGQRYQTYGFPRTGYLPANEKGKKVLKLLQKAWKRKLIFTIGTSTTTGISNAVIWNEIHHKTSPIDDGSGHGYPDPKYLDNVIEELKQHGVNDDDDDDAEADSD